MKKYAPYLYRSRHDVFYYRRILPEPLSTILNKNEFKKSLRTTNPSTAIYLTHFINRHLEEIMKKNHIGFTIKTSNGTQIVELKIDPNNREAEIAALKELGLFDKVSEMIQPPDSSPCATPTDKPVAQSQPQPKTLPLSELIEKYCADCIAEGRWTDRTEKLNRQSLDTLLFILGNRSCASIDRDTARSVRDKLTYYPAQRNKRVRFKGLTMEQIMEMDDVETIAPKTVNKNLTIYGSLFLWGKREKLVDSNPFEKLKVKDREAPGDKRSPFDKHDLGKIFGSTLYTAHDFSEAYRYWTPLIALFSGARLNEIAQLEVSDIHQVDDIYVFDINDTDTKRTKNKQSIRQVPVHSKLIELGLIEYRDRLEKRGETRLFPELTLDARGSYSRKISDWFNPTYLPAVGVDPSKKKLHCFRSTLAIELEDVGTPHEQIQQVAGHKTSKSILQKHYLKPNVRLMSEWLEKVRFGDTLEDVKKFNSQ